MSAVAKREPTTRELLRDSCAVAFRNPSSPGAITLNAAALAGFLLDIAQRDEHADGPEAVAMVALRKAHELVGEYPSAREAAKHLERLIEEETPKGDPRP